MSLQENPFLDDVMTYEATTRDIHIEVQSYYMHEESNVESSQFFWAYRIHITNDSDQIIQLLDRHWHITNARGMTEEVHGDGVIGEQPTLAPGDTYAYTSGCPLITSSGFMHGSFGMITLDGQKFDVKIPAFSLDSPHQDLFIN